MFPFLAAMLPFIMQAMGSAGSAAAAAAPAAAGAAGTAASALPAAGGALEALTPAMASQLPSWLSPSMIQGVVPQMGGSSMGGGLMGLLGQGQGALGNAGNWLVKNSIPMSMMSNTMRNAQGMMGGGAPQQQAPPMQQRPPMQPSQPLSFGNSTFSPHQVAQPGGGQGGQGQGLQALLMKLMGGGAGGGMAGY